MTEIAYAIAISLTALAAWHAFGRYIVYREKQIAADATLLQRIGELEAAQAAFTAKHDKALLELAAQVQSEIGVRSEKEEPLVVRLRKLETAAGAREALSMQGQLGALRGRRI